ncbi:MAG: hypothetical protein HQ579_03520 [Candidatus Omnitrophica bacterium]|nr:hypothetical protein [Candidatus Omnitrophota bacterium]
MKKLISIILTITFLISNVSFASDIALSCNAKGNTNLAANLAFDIGIAPTHQKPIAVAKMALMSDLEEIDELRDIDGTTDYEVIRNAFKTRERLKGRQVHEEKTNEEHKPAVIAASYLNDIKPLSQKRPSHIFKVPVSVEKAGIGYNLLLLFSTVRNKDGKFPIAFCTEEQLTDEIVDKIIDFDKLPQLSQEDNHTIEKFTQQEEFDINVLEWLHNEWKDRNTLLHEISIKDYIEKILKLANIELDNVDSINGRKCFVAAITPEVRERLQTYKLKIRDINNNEMEVIAYEHSSNGAIHIFLEHDIFNSIINPFSSEWSQSGEAIPILKGYLVHALGVMTGSPILEFGADGRPINEIDQRYLAAEEGNRPRSTKTLNVVDLDILRTDEYERDYASGKKTTDDIQPDKPFRLVGVKSFQTGGGMMIPYRIIFLWGDYHITIKADEEQARDLARWETNEPNRKLKYAVIVRNPLNMRKATWARETTATFEITYSNDNSGQTSVTLKKAKMLKKSKIKKLNTDLKQWLEAHIGERWQENVIVSEFDKLVFRYGDNDVVQRKTRTSKRTVKNPENALRVIATMSEDKEYSSVGFSFSFEEFEAACKASRISATIYDLQELIETDVLDVFSEGLYDNYFLTYKGKKALEKLQKRKSASKPRSLTKAGKSPEDAKMVIALSALLEKGSFTLDEYLTAYEEVLEQYPELEFEALAKNPKSTARRDLSGHEKSLVKQGILSILEKTTPHVFKITGKGKQRLLALCAKRYKEMFRDKTTEDETKQNTLYKLARETVSAIVGSREATRVYSSLSQEEQRRAEAKEDKQTRLFINILDGITNPDLLEKVIQRMEEENRRATEYRKAAIQERGMGAHRDLPFENNYHHATKLMQERLDTLIALSTQDGDRDAKSQFVNKPGKSPEDAFEVIVWSDSLQEGSFTLQDYKKAYDLYKNLRNKLHGLPPFDKLAKSWQHTARTDLNALVRRGLLTCDESSKTYRYELTLRGKIHATLDTLPREYNERPTSRRNIQDALNSTYEVMINLAMQGIQGERLFLTPKSALIFSESITFEHGLGVLLPRLVKAGINIGVITRTEEEKEIINEINENELKDYQGKIISLDRIEGAPAKMNASKCYYFRVEGEDVRTFEGVIVIDIAREKVMEILKALGQACKIIESGLIERMQKAAIKFAQAA